MLAPSSPGFLVRFPLVASAASAAAGDGKLSITREAPDHGGTIRAWEWLCGEDSGSCPVPWTGWVWTQSKRRSDRGPGAAAKSHNVTGLENGTDYVFSIRAVSRETIGIASTSVVRSRRTPVCRRRQLSLPGLGAVGVHLRTVQLEANRAMDEDGRRAVACWNQMFGSFEAADFHAVGLEYGAVP